MKTRQKIRVVFAQLCLVVRCLPLGIRRNDSARRAQKIIFKSLSINELRILSTLNIVTIIVCIDAECRHYQRSVSLATYAHFCELGGILSQPDAGTGYYAN